MSTSIVCTPSRSARLLPRLFLSAASRLGAAAPGPHSPALKWILLAAALLLAPSIARADLASGALVTGFDDWSASSPGYQIYCSSRRQAPNALRLFIDLVRERRLLEL